MKNIRTLFEYQKFEPDRRIQAKIDRITEKYLSGATALEDEELDVAAAGDMHQSAAPTEQENAERK